MFIASPLLWANQKTERNCYWIHRRKWKNKRGKIYRLYRAYCSTWTGSFKRQTVYRSYISPKLAFVSF